MVTLTCREILACRRFSSRTGRRFSGCSSRCLRGGASRKSCSRLGGRGGRGLGESASGVIFADRGLCRRGRGRGRLCFGEAQIETRRGRCYFVMSVSSTNRTPGYLLVRVVVSIGFEMTVVT